MKTKNILMMLFAILVVVNSVLTFQPVKKVQSYSPTLWNPFTQGAPTIQPNPCFYKDCHTIKFYLPTAWQSQYGKNKLRKWLKLYVDDMNYILSKNTNRLLQFYPLSGIIFTDEQPHTNMASLPLPNYLFEIWAQVIQSQTGHSHGGYGGLDESGVFLAVISTIMSLLFRSRLTYYNRMKLNNTYLLFLSYREKDRLGK